MTKIKKGFTLIELLVVVLIVGILAAVALPQYQKAVDKVRMTRLIPMARAIADAQQRYFWANNELANKVEDLDLDFNVADVYDCTPGGLASQCIYFGKDSCSINSYNHYVYCSTKSSPNVRVEYGVALPGYKDHYHMGQRGCIGYNEGGYKLCQALGGQQSSTSGSTRYYSLP